MLCVVFIFFEASLNLLIAYSLALCEAVTDEKSFAFSVVFSVQLPLV